MHLIFSLDLSNLIYNCKKKKLNTDIKKRNILATQCKIVKNLWLLKSYVLCQNVNVQMFLIHLYVRNR
jgi:hypothetical protein